MLKKTVKIVFSILVAGFLLALLIIIENKTIVANTSDINKKRVYSSGPLPEVFQYSLLLTVFFFIVYSIIKLFLQHIKRQTYKLALVTGLVVLAIWYILTNTLAITRPRINDLFYIIDLFTMFGIGCMFPYIEKFMDKIAAKF